MDGASPPRLNTRQRINSNAAVWALRQVAATGWLFHIDGDEVIDVDPDELNSLPEDLPGVSLAVLEAVAQWDWPDDHVTHFKRELSDDELNLLLMLGLIDKADNLRYFRGHVGGKPGVNLSSRAWLGTHRVVDEHRNSIASHAAEWLRVLHYESYCYDDFKRKWRNLNASGPGVASRDRRERLAGAIRAATRPGGVAPEWVMRELFERHACDNFEALLDLGLLVQSPAPERGSTGEVVPGDAVLKELQHASRRDKQRFALRR